MIVRIEQLKELLDNIQQIIVNVANDNNCELLEIGYYFETDDITGDDLPQITHQTLEQFTNEYAAGFQLTHLRLVNRLVLRESQRILTTYIDHQQEVTLLGSINDRVTNSYTYPDDRLAFTQQLSLLIGNAFE